MLWHLLLSKQICGWFFYMETKAALTLVWLQDEELKVPCQVEILWLQLHTSR
jgi:hypothetical protein